MPLTTTCPDFALGSSRFHIFPGAAHSSELPTGRLAHPPGRRARSSGARISGARSSGARSFGADVGDVSRRRTPRTRGVATRRVPGAECAEQGLAIADAAADPPEVDAGSDAQAAGRGGTAFCSASCDV